MEAGRWFEGVGERDLGGLSFRVWRRVPAKVKSASEMMQQSFKGGSPNSNERKRKKKERSRGFLGNPLGRSFSKAHDESQKSPFVASVVKAW